MFDFLSNMNLFDVYLILFGFIPIFILVITTLFNLTFGPFLRKIYPINHQPAVSVLVPARNEEKNIENCVRSLMSQDYSDFELIVLDDNSSDNTFAILKNLQTEFPQLNILKGQLLPQDWLGKNFACKQLADNAQGEILIFTDADNTHSKFAIRNTIAYMSKYKLDLLSAFPQQITQNFFEKLLVPIIDIIIYSGLPLWTTLYIPNRAFAAANGQWIAFKKDSYDSVGGHYAVKSQVVEDVEFARLFKSKGHRILTTIGTDVVFCRMYSSLKEIRTGLSKNLFGLTGYNSFLFFLILLIAFSSMVLPFILFPLNFSGKLLILLIIMNLILRIVHSLAFRHDLLISLLLHPFSIIGIVLIATESFYKTLTGKIVWKERKIQNY